jgi:hydrogenase maturation protease
MNQGTEPGILGRVLVIGYGNPLRNDDGAGHHVARAVAAWTMTQVEVLAVQQLTPELAEPLANARLAIFVDACAAGPGDKVQIAPLEAAESVAGLGHTSNPQELLALTKAVYGHHPPAWSVLIPGRNFSTGEDLSSQASNGIKEALNLIAALLRAERTTGR